MDANPILYTDANGDNSSTSTTEYTVKRGDNMSTIAKAHGVEASKLMAENPDIAKRTNATIYPGDKVKIPGKSSNQTTVGNTNPTANTMAAQSGKSSSVLNFVSSKEVKQLEDKKKQRDNLFSFQSSSDAQKEQNQSSVSPEKPTKSTPQPIPLSEHGVWNMLPKTDGNTRINTTTNSPSNIDEEGKWKWLHKTSDIIGYTGTGEGVKGEILDYSVRQNYKSARTMREFDKLRKTQKEWRMTNTLGKTGVKYVKFCKGVAIISNAVGIIDAGVHLTEKNSVGNWTRLGVQVLTMGIAFVPVFGWGIALGIGFIDAVWGDAIYEMIDRKSNP